MILSILVIYLILMCWYSYGWIRRNLNFSIRTKRELVANLCVVSGVVIIFILVLRILVLFKERKTLDIIQIGNEFDFISMVIIFIFLYSLRRLVIFIFKVCWFKLHWFFLSPFNLTTSTIYGHFYFDYIYVPGCKHYKNLQRLNIIAILGLFLMLMYDFAVNRGILDISLWYLKYYSLFKIVYLGSRFLANKQIMILDYYTHSMIYSGIIDQSPFHANMDPNHRAMMGEAMKYGSGVIRESYKYIPGKKIDVAKIDFFKNYSVHQEFIQHYWDLKNKGEL